VTDHLTFGLSKENKLHAVQRKTKNIPWDKSSQTGGRLRRWVKEVGIFFPFLKYLETIWTFNYTFPMCLVLYVLEMI
jgi:hypothetical protein